MKFFCLTQNSWLVSIKRVSEVRVFSSLALSRIFFPSGMPKYLFKLVNRSGQRERRGGITVSCQALHHGSEPMSNC